MTIVDRFCPSPPVGRALLTWAGKHLPDGIALPSPQKVEAFGSVSEDKVENRLYYGDNAGILAHLLSTGLRRKVRLIYIDPPFDSNADYSRKIRLRDGDASVLDQQVQYSDSWSGDSYLQFMYERLLLLRDCLAEDGTIWLHCDYRQVHRLHLLLEEVFGEENYLNTISWRSQVTRGAKVNAFYFPYSTQFIAIFAKNRAAPSIWHPQKKLLEFTRRQAASQFMEDEHGFFRTSDPGTYSFEKLCELHAASRLYAPYEGEIVIDEENRTVSTTNGGNIGVKYYLHRLDNGRYGVERGVDNLWDDIPGLGTTPGEEVGYPTQKTEALLRRVILASTNPGDIVLDCFTGSGTTLAVAQKLGRRWIGCDANYGSVQTTRRRLQRIIQGGSDTDPFSLWTAASLPAEAESRVDLQIRRIVEEPATIEVKVEAYAQAGLTAKLATRGTTGHWQTLIDAIEIDPDYDGSCYRPKLVDAPQKKRQQIQGFYRLSLPTAKLEPAVVAVRVTDVLGRETMIVQEV